MPTRTTRASLEDIVARVAQWRGIFQRFGRAPPHTRVLFSHARADSGAARVDARRARARRRRRWVAKNIAHPFAPRAGDGGVRASSTAVKCASDADVAKGCGVREASALVVARIASSTSSSPSREAGHR